MYARLSCKSAGIELNIEKGGELVVGRDPGSVQNGYALDNPYISRVHAVFTYKNELYVQDMGSINGSHVNGRRLRKDEMVPLSEGDFIRLGNLEFRLHFEGKSDRRKQNGGFRYEMRNTVGGRKLQVTTEERGCIKYQIRMIEENPSLCIADVTHVSSLQNDSFLCELGSYISLSDMMEQKPGRVKGEEIFEKILKAVKDGEECMLTRSKYIISPDTIFLDMEGSIRLIYVPCVDRMEDRFAEGMAVLCDYFIKNSRDKDRKKLTALKNICRSGINDTSEMMKEMYKLGDYSVEIRREIKDAETVSKDDKLKMKAEYVVTLLSFAGLIALVWTGKLSTTNIAALLLIVAGINVVMYGNKSKKKKETGGEKNKKEKSKDDMKTVLKKMFSKD